MSIVQVLTDAVREGSADKVLELAKKFVAFDVETWLVQPGLLAPPLVCGSLAWFDEDSREIKTKFLTKDEARAAFDNFLDDEDVVLVGQNVVFDVLVMAHDAAKRGIDLFPKIFKMYEQGRVYDVMLGQILHAIAGGTLNLDPFTMRGLRGRYSLGTVVNHLFGRDDAKKNDKWRLRYAELDKIPYEQWPEDAKIYPLDDARNTLEACLAQCGALPKREKHVWATVGGKFGCVHCGPVELGDSLASASECWRCEPHQNLHSIHDQCETHFAMHLGAAWGFKVDQVEVKRVAEAAADEKKLHLPKFRELGWYRADGSRDTGAIARAVALAYDAIGLCGACAGTGKVPSPKTGNPIQCKECSATGLDIRNAPDVPLTETERISKTRDVLDESGDEDLIALAEFGRLDKTIDSYCPFLAKAGSKPLNLKPNPMLESDRTSYSDLIQTFPRDKGLRDCIVARPQFVFSSADYKAGELVTLSQSAIEIVGYSDMADVLNAGRDLHIALGAEMLGVTYEDLESWLRDPSHPKHKLAKAARTAAKAGNFGLGGLMSAARLALTQRRQGPDTPCPNGPAIIVKAKDGKPEVRGYRGLRFCILMDGADRCGERKISEWKRRPIAPVCARCVECADRLRDVWFGKWSEMKPFFEFASYVERSGQEDGLEPGQMVQLVSRIVRGGCKTPAIANGFFQSRLARAAKLALRRMQRECCDRSYRVPGDAQSQILGRASEYAGLDSPLRGSRVVAFYHDETFAELWRKQKHDAATRQSEIMVQALRETCPDVAPAVEAPAALQAAWKKAAEPMHHVVNGRLELVEWADDHKDPKKCAECCEAEAFAKAAA